MRLEVEVLRNHIQEEMGEINFDLTKPFIQINVFKGTGKWYATKYAQLEQAHVDLINSNVGFDLLDLIQNNDPSVAVYSPLGTNFSDNSLKYVVDVFNCEGFCKRLI